MTDHGGFELEIGCVGYFGLRNLSGQDLSSLFTLVGFCCAISLSAFGYLHPWKSSSSTEKCQLGFRFTDFAFILTNLFVFTLMTIEVSVVHSSKFLNFGVVES